MIISIIDTGFFKLDGGAMFGVVPKQMWNRMNPPDEKNRCTWAMRCLLIETEDRKILVDTGLGNKQDAKFRSHFEPHGSGDLLNSIQNQSLKVEDITDVFLTHLHFDHCGGAVSKDKKGHLLPTFPNAQYWVNGQHLDWALKPNPRERASFLKENFTPLEDHAVLNKLPTQNNFEWIPGINLVPVFGHTEAMTLLEIKIKDTLFIYAADLIPSSSHIGLPYVMGYDTRPLKTMEEKEHLYEKIIGTNAVIIFEHDPIIECATIKKNDRGRVVLDKTGDLVDFM